MHAVFTIMNMTDYFWHCSSHFFEHTFHEKPGEVNKKTILGRSLPFDAIGHLRMIGVDVVPWLRDQPAEFPH
jgi:hypothetical protein